MKILMKNTIKKERISQQGFSLLEVLISMVIGLFLLVGITSSYLSSKKSSLVRDEVSILEDNGRAALELLTESLQHTGTVPTADFITNTADGDSIGTIYLGDQTLNTDCNGDVNNRLPDPCLAGETVIDTVNAHKIYNTFYVDGAEEQLKCRGSLIDEQTVLAEGIENMQILYGVDLDSDSNAERYVTSDDVGNWGNVVSLQVAILVKATRETKNVAEAISYSLLDQQVATGPDRFERAVFTTSIKLRNL